LIGSISLFAISKGPYKKGESIGVMPLATDANGKP
jgi:hypothetical protein